MKILLIYRPTAEGKAALATAREEAQRREATVVAVRHVKGSVEQPVPDVPTLGRSSFDPVSPQDAATLRAEMRSLREDLEADGIDADAVLLTEGSDAAEAILEFATEEQVELIVIGIRRRSPVGKLVLGSLAQDILLQADCPVLAVKAD